MSVQILYFASLRERLGSPGESFELPPGVGDVAGVLAELRGRGEPWSEVLRDEQSVLCAVNQEMAKPDSPVTDGDEVGLFPPVTGG